MDLQRLPQAPWEITWHNLCQKQAYRPTKGIRRRRIIFITPPVSRTGPRSLHRLELVFRHQMFRFGPGCTAMMADAISQSSPSETCAKRLIYACLTCGRHLQLLVLNTILDLALAFLDPWMQHASDSGRWLTCAENALAGQKLAGKAYGLGNLADLDGTALITSEAESNRLLGRAVDRVNLVLSHQPDKWDMILTAEASIQHTASTVSSGALCPACISDGQTPTAQPPQQPCPV